MSWVLFIVLSPSVTYAGLFSSILGGQVFAQANTSDPIESKDNSQNMALLQANAFPIFIPKDEKITDTKIDSSIDVNIVSDNALMPTASPVGIGGVGGPDILETSTEDVSIYVVRKGDTLSVVAEMFNVSVDTILAANDMKKGEKLVEGDVLLILPISGIKHTIVKGETLASIAKHYDADVDDIIIYNGISAGAKLAIGDKLMIPGADMADEGGDKPAANLSGAVVKDQNYYATHPVQNLAGYFVNPLPTGRKTQGLHGPGHRGIDIGAPTGTPIYASASGTALIVKTGCVVGRRNCGGGYGNMAIIQHPNGTKTLYGHMSKVNTLTGAQVSQGQLIGFVGSTGHSTGPHLHFEVFFAKNPGADWSWKK